jgi:hypothetical protein
MLSARHLRCVLASTLALSAAAHADVFYSNTFESGTLGPEWGSTARLDQGANFSKFLGRYSENTPTVLNNSVSLTLPRPADDTGNPGSGGTGTTWYAYNLTFDFYCIDAWHGTDPSSGPDKFEVFINGSNMLSNTYSNTGAGQSAPAPTLGPIQLGFGASSPDSIYRNISIDFLPGSSTQLTFKWRSDGLTGVNNESWGVDNIRVGYTLVPAPGSLALLGLGGLASLRRRRR